MTETTFKLSTPLKTHAGIVNELKLKPPKARLMINHGDPFRIQPIRNDAGELQGHEYAFNNKAITEFAADMTGIDTIILSDLSVSDFMGLRRAIADLILEVVKDKNPSEQPVT